MTLLYLSAAEIYSINEAILGRQPIVRDRHLLRSAALRPYTRMFGQDAYPTLIDKAAALLHALAHDHLFADGNKRTAREATRQFIERNAARLTWTDDEAYTLILDIAKGRYDAKQVAACLTPFVKAHDRA